MEWRFHAGSWEPSGGGSDDNAMPQCTDYVYKRLYVCNRPDAMNNTDDTVQRRKACQSDGLDKVAILMC